MNLRPYQSRVLADLWQWFEDHAEGDPIVEASVGAGKSIMIAEFCRRAIEAYADTRILMLVHVKELLEQNTQKLMAVWPQAPVGVYSASVARRQMGRAITYATIGSVAKRAHELGRIDLCLVDECHLISDNDQTMYRRLIDELRRYCPHMRVVGWTGTAFRGSGIWLTQQGLFSHVASRITMAELLRDGFLAPLTPGATQTHISTDGVRTSGGDYVVGALAKATDTTELVHSACAELVRMAADRRKWLVFAVTVEHAAHICETLGDLHGIDCAVVSADTPKRERAALIADFRAGRLRCLINVAVLTTGFDAPEVDCIALLRATKSPVLYVQIAGRGMRTAPGKTDCLWLDFTDTTLTLGPVDAIKGRAKPPKRDAPAGGPQADPTKTCDQCGNPAPLSATACEVCGHAFPPPQRINHGAQVMGGSVLSGGPAWLSITSVSYRRHLGREGKPDSLRVDYFSGFRVAASEWVCLEHPPGFARSKAQAWWARRGLLPVPETIDDALARTDDLIQPGRIALQVSGKYPEIVSHDFGPQLAPLAVHPAGPAREPAAL
jgi:DNA repair protein RadD